MKRLLLAMLVLGLVGFATMEDGTCPLGHRLPGFGHALRARAVAEEQKAAERAAREAERARRDLLRTRTRTVARREAGRPVRESVADIPVPIVPGTRVVDAAPVPPAPPSPPSPPKPPRTDGVPAGEIHKAVGRPSATEDRAKVDARRQLREDVADWLAPEVGPSWRPSERQLDAMVVGVRVSPEAKPYATIYTAEIDADFSADRRGALIRSHRQAVVRGRIIKLAALLGFVLICLAAVSGYIRTDEATRGYYTNRLRMLAAAGVGAAGAVIYQMIA